MPDRAEMIVSKILMNLSDRRGIRQAFDECDPEILAEIKETLTDIVREILGETPDAP